MLFIPANVGGRFSILSAVGIVPLCFCGYNAKALLEGAKACFEDFYSQKDEILQKAYHYCTHKNANINVLFHIAMLLKALMNGISSLLLKV